MKVLKIDITKINPNYYFKGEKGTYLDCILTDNPDKYGNDGRVVQTLPRELREPGKFGPYIGSWRELGEKTQHAQERDYQKGKAPRPERYI